MGKPKEKMKYPKRGTVCEIEFDGTWIPGVIDGYTNGEIEEDFKRVNVLTDDGRMWRGCSPQSVRVNGKELQEGPF